jgi:phenylpropionate dioxygenase-like ring-hydroxylating dioxygenase large terminal subunit
MFLRNYWYVAASHDEVTRKPLGRIILGEPVVLFRTEACATTGAACACGCRGRT